MTDEILAPDVLTADVIKRAIRTLRREPPEPRCPYCGALGVFHIRIRTASPELLTYARERGYICP